MWDWLRRKGREDGVGKKAETIAESARLAKKETTGHPHAAFLEAIANHGGTVALDELVAAVGRAQAAELIDQEIGSTLNLAKYTGSLVVLARLRPLVKSLEALEDHRAAMYAEVCTRRRLPGW